MTPRQKRIWLAALNAEFWRQVRERREALRAEAMARVIERTRPVA